MNAIPLDRYQLHNAVEKVSGYYLPRPSDVTHRHQRAFDRAKAECTDHLAKQLEAVQSLTFEQFCAAKKVKVTPETTAWKRDSHMALANIYVPITAQRMDIVVKPGSGIVALQDQAAPSGDVTLYYEGNVYGAENLNTLEDRIKCAAGRMFNRALTVAMFTLPKDELDRYVKAVGTIDDQYNIQFTDEAAARTYGDLYQSR